MLRWFLITALAVALVTADQHDNTVDIGATVKEVENMLAKDPRLPRLTRGEILKLIDEVRIGKDVVVVLPDNQNPSFNESDWTSTTAKPRRPAKRRRKKPAVRPVYVHSTPQPTGTDNDTVPAQSSTHSSPEITAVESVTPTSTTNKIRITVGTRAPQQGGAGLPPVPGLEVVDDINSWNVPAKSGPGKKTQTQDLFITPLPPVSSSTRAPPTPDVQDAPPNVKVAAESLGPEMKDLLTRFGLLNTESTTRRIYQAPLPAPTIDPQVYSRFKPLPYEGSADFVSPDMKSFLASYGLLDSRRGKDLKTEETQESKSPLEYIPSREKEILTQLGLWRDGKAIDIGSFKNMPKHVFKPKVDESNSKEKLEKVSKILTKLKEIGEGDETQLKQLSPSDVEELLQLEDNTRLAAQGDLELGINSESLVEKNEVKRTPQDSGPVSASASASASASSGSGASASAVATAGIVPDGDSSGQETTTAATDSDASSSSSFETSEAPTATESIGSGSGDTTEAGASAVDLEESFGGGGATTTKRPNGFYFLLDWNSFLDVGLDDRAIHLNFSPKVGDPANFLPVTIGNSQPARR